MKSRIQRALIDSHGLSRNLPQPLRDAVAMRRLQRQNLKNQHVERALRDWKSRWRHKVNPDASINRDYLNLRHMTVDHRRPAVKRPLSPQPPGDDISTPAGPTPHELDAVERHSLLLAKRRMSSAIAGSQGVDGSGSSNLNVNSRR